MTTPEPAPGPTPEPAPGPAPELARDAEWQRLDPRMLLVHPIREVVRFLPGLVLLVVAGTAAGGETWQLAFVVVPVLLGLVRYLTTRFRIGDGRIELQRGLLNRHVLSTPVDRVRTVDLTSSPVHRVLGLTTVRIGTGTAASDEDGLDLDGLPVARARELRAELLRAGPADATTHDPAAPAPAEEPPVVAFDPAWIRYAPLTGSGVVIAAAAFGAASQLLNSVGGWDRLDPDRLDAPSLSIGVLVVVLLLAALVVVSLLAIGGYVVTNWGFRLTRVPGSGDWHLTRGLFTTRETTLDVDRVAGVGLSEPVGLRLARGARLSAIVTGLDRKEAGSSLLVPPAPRAVSERTAGVVLGTAAPVVGPLLPHGPRAVRRRWTRALVPALVPVVAAVVAVALGAPRWVLAAVVLLPLAAALAADRARSLGHALVEGHLASRSGSLVRRRRVLAVDHVIGWNLRATWWQRRAGLTTLVATTAGGSQAVEVLDVPEDEAVRVAHEAMPQLVAQFLSRTDDRPPLG